MVMRLIHIPMMIFFLKQCVSLCTTKIVRAMKDMRNIARLLKSTQRFLQFGRNARCLGPRGPVTSPRRKASLLNLPGFHARVFFYNTTPLSIKTLILVVGCMNMAMQAWLLHAQHTATTSTKAKTQKKYEKHPVALNCPSWKPQYITI